jgi:hypothetical protein
MSTHQYHEGIKILVGVFICMCFSLLFNMKRGCSLSPVTDPAADKEKGEEESSEISVSHGGECEDDSVLGYYETTRRNIPEGCHLQEERSTWKDTE